MVRKCLTHRVSVLLISSVSRVSGIIWRSFISPLTEFSLSLLQIPILNKNKRISIFGPYHPSRVMTLCTYCLSSDHKCGGEIP